MTGRASPVIAVALGLALGTMSCKRIDLELKRLEIATRERLAKLHETMRGNIQEARQALQSVLESPLTMTPREASSGREYAIAGRLVLGEALALAPSPDETRGLRVADNSRPYVDDFRTALMEMAA